MSRAPPALPSRSNGNASASKVTLTFHESDSESDDEAEVAAQLAAGRALANELRASPDDIDTWKVRTAPTAAWADNSTDGAFRGESLVGSTVSILDVNGQRTNAKVVVYMDGGSYMVRSGEMQFVAELDAAMRSRECWIVSKGK